MKTRPGTPDTYSRLERYSSSSVLELHEAEALLPASLEAHCPYALPNCVFLNLGIVLYPALRKAVFTRCGYRTARPADISQVRDCRLLSFFVGSIVSLVDRHRFSFGDAQSDSESEEGRFALSRPIFQSTLLAQRHRLLRLLRFF